MSLLPIGATPSDQAAHSLPDDLRRQLVAGDQETLLAAQYVRRTMQTSGRIVGVSSFLRTGGGNASAAKVTLNGTTILSANITFDGAANGDTADGALDEDHDNWDGTGITFVSGDIVGLETVTAGGGAKGLTLEARILV